MAGLREIQGQIRSVKNTAKLTNAMKMVASVRLGKLEQKTKEGSKYHDAFEGLFKRIMNIVGEIDHPLSKDPIGGKHLFILITGDKGLCGSYNSNVLKLLADRIKELNLQADDYMVYSIGKKGRSLALYRGVSLLDDYVENLSSDLPDEDMKEILGRITDGYISGEWREVEILYTKYINQSKYLASSSTLLPFRVEESAEQENVDSWIFEPGPDVIAKMLVPVAVKGIVFRSLQESMTCEQAARMIAMTQATDNAKDIEKQKTKLFNKLRQEAITSELLDIIGGAEAIN
ncbi:ATP synthase F1 subunit gamma [bacterium]|nr:ATP synthase F1 subunit gamma [bacterium]|tara:strand:- start:7065 stop:7931 length:867 start_codon:yes stop_codon:yes gene_type:complete